MFFITRVYSDSHGDSRLEDIQIPLKDHGSIGRLSAKFPADGVLFREVDLSYDYDFHTAPQRRFIILLNGEIEIETLLGEKEFLELATYCLWKIGMVKDTAPETCRR